MGESKLPSKLMRNYFLVKMPIKKPTIELTPEAEKAYFEDQLEKTTKLEVVLASDKCAEVKEGDVVRLKNGAFLMGEVIEKNHILFSENDVILIY